MTWNTILKCIDRFIHKCLYANIAYISCNFLYRVLHDHGLISEILFYLDSLERASDLLGEILK